MFTCHATQQTDLGPAPSFHRRRLGWMALPLQPAFFQSVLRNNGPAPGAVCPSWPLIGLQPGHLGWPQIFQNEFSGVPLGNEARVGRSKASQSWLYEFSSCRLFFLWFVLLWLEHISVKPIQKELREMVLFVSRTQLPETPLHWVGKFQINSLKNDSPGKPH